MPALNFSAEGTGGGAASGAAAGTAVLPGIGTAIGAILGGLAGSLGGGGEAQALRQQSPGWQIRESSKVQNRVLQETQANLRNLDRFGPDERLYDKRIANLERRAGSLVRHNVLVPRSVEDRIQHYLGEDTPQFNTVSTVNEYFPAAGIDYDAFVAEALSETETPTPTFTETGPTPVEEYLSPPTVVGTSSPPVIVTAGSGGGGGGPSELPLGLIAAAMAVFFLLKG